MSWLLDTAIDVGDLDAQDYTHLRIRRLMHMVQPNNAMLQVTIEYGIDDAGDWTRGKAPRTKETHFNIRGADYDALMAHASNDGEATFDAVERAIMTWLNTSGHIDDGTIV